MSRPVVAAVVPVRSLDDGKSRLAGDLTAEERAGAIRSMLEHVVGSVVGSGEVARLAVVTPDARAATAAAALDPRVEVLRQGATDPGLNRAIEIGREWALAAGADRLLVLFADLPLLTAADVRAVLAADAPVVVARDRHGQGTNVLAVALDPVARRFRFRFGAGSADRHAAEAAALGLRVAVVDRPGTGFDLDDARDLRDLGGVPGALPTPVAAGEAR